MIQVGEFILREDRGMAANSVASFDIGIVKRLLRVIPSPTGLGQA